MKSKVTVDSIIEKKSVKPEWKDLQVGTFFTGDNDGSIRIKTTKENYIKFEEYAAQTFNEYQYKALYNVIILDVSISATERV